MVESVEASEFLTHIHQTQFQFQQVVKKCLFEPKVGNPPGLSPCVHFLNKLECIRIDPCAQIFSSTLGNIALETGSFPADHFLEVQVDAEKGLIRISPGLTKPFRITAEIVLTSTDIPGHLTEVIEVKIDTPVVEEGTQPLPVAGNISIVILSPLFRGQWGFGIKGGTHHWNLSGKSGEGTQTQ